jgi:hypothetical protein
VRGNIVTETQPACGPDPLPCGGRGRGEGRDGSADPLQVLPDRHRRHEMGRREGGGINGAVQLQR